MRIRHASLGLVAVTFAGLIACNDDAFLTESPSNFVSPEQFYRNAGDATAAVNSVYAAFINGSGDNYYGRNFFMLVEYPTEAVTAGRLSGTNERSLPDNFAYLPNHSYIESVWTSAYNAINRANSVLDNVPGITMDANLKTRILAEAKFLRALHYFNLVRLFGDVPIRTTETKNLESLQITKSTAAQVYTQIVTDLKDAIAGLPQKSAYTGSDIGRATLGAARTLLGKVYLQRAATVTTAGVAIGAPVDYDSAQTYLNLVVNEPAPNNYALVPNVMTLWDFYGGTVSESNTEVIFDIQNTRAPGVGGRISSHMAPNATAPALGASTNGSVAAELNFYSSYLVADARRNATWLTSWTSTNGTVNTWQPPPAAVNTAGNNAYASNTPFPRKFLDKLMPSVGAEEPNFVVLRYADVLLMLAEAINERTGPATALTYINQVRTRAGIPNVPGAVTQAQLRDSISLERRWELVLEGHGHFDSQRNWTWAKARIEANLVRGRSPTNNNLPDPTGGNRYPRSNSGSPCTGTGAASVCTLTMKFYYYPIPQRALDLNKTLVQNPLWP